MNAIPPPVPGRPAPDAPDGPPAGERVVVGDDSRLREVRGTRDARAADLAHARGDTVQRPALRPEDHADRADRADGGRTGRSDRDDPDGRDDEDALIGGFRGSDVGGRRARTATDSRTDARTGDDVAGDDPEDPDGRDPAKPVGEALGGFFVGMGYVLVLPVLWWVLSDPDSPSDLLSADLVFFLPAILVPVALAVAPRTRRFGRYMLLGVGLSAVVVVGVAALVLAVLIVTGR